MFWRRYIGLQDCRITSKAGVFLVLVLLLAGCHTARHAAVAPDGQAEEPAPVVAPQRTYTVITFTGEVEGISVAGQLRMAEDSVIWVSMNKVIEMGRAMATPDSLWLRAPLLGRDDALDYATLRRTTGVGMTFDELQQMVSAEDAEVRIERMAKQLGARVTLKFTDRRRVDHLTFPYPKPQRP